MTSRLDRIRIAAPWTLALAAALVMAGTRREKQRDSPAESVMAPSAGGSLVSARRSLMGTDFVVTIWAPGGETDSARRILAATMDNLAELEQRISSWLPGSETTRVNRAAGTHAVPVGEECERLLRRSLYWSEQTGGAFDVSGGPLVDLWQRARERGVPPSDDEIARIRALTGSEQIRLTGGHAQLLKAGMKLEFGAIGKGFAADQAADILRAAGLTNFLIDAGGDLLASGRKGDHPWHIAVRHPRRRDGFLARFETDGCAVATSGDYERYFIVGGQRYAHIIDARTGRPARHLAGVTVFTRSATDADALATALFVMEPARGMELVGSLPDVEALMVDGRGAVTLSPGLRRHGDQLILDPP